MNLRNILESPDSIDTSYKYLYAVPIDGLFTLDSPIGYRTLLTGGKRVSETQEIKKQLLAGIDPATWLHELNNRPTIDAIRSRKYRVNNPRKIKSIESTPERRAQKADWAAKRRQELKEQKLLALGVSLEEIERIRVQEEQIKRQRIIDAMEKQQRRLEEEKLKQQRAIERKNKKLSKPIGSPKKLAREAAKKRAELKNTVLPNNLKRELTHLEILARDILKDE